MGAPEIGIFVEYTSTVISLICLPINILFVMMIVRESRSPILGTPFFRLCIHLSLADILMTLFALVLFKLPIFGWLPDSFFGDDWAVIPIAGINYFGHAQAIGIIFIAVNRYTAVYYPIKHKQTWWRPSTMIILLVIQWTLPVVFVMPLFFTHFSFFTDHSSGSVSVTAKDPFAYFIGVALVDGFIVNVIVSAFYFKIFMRVRCCRSHVVVRRPEQLVARLALSAFVIFISYLALGIFSHHLLRLGAIITELFGISKEFQKVLGRSRTSTSYERKSNCGRPDIECIIYGRHAFMWYTVIWVFAS